VTWSAKLGCPDTRIKMGEEWARRILRHLLKNAFRAIPPSKIPARVSIRTYVKEGFVQLLVHDTGEGVPDPVRDQLFRRQIGGERPQRGRGLMLVRYVMEMHGGTINLSSTRTGQGSSFLLRFPISTEVR
jgi:signal transduction histidine kinase